MTDAGGEGIDVQVVPGLRTSWLGHLIRSLVTLGAYDQWRLWDPE